MLNTAAKQLHLPIEKLEELTGLTKSWLFKHKATQRELLLLIGKLSFVAKVFCLEWDCHVPGTRLDSCGLLHLFTDASGSRGFGAYYNGVWFWGDWQQHQCLPLNSIQWQELFTTVAATSTWGHLWAWSRLSTRHPDLMQLL